MALPTIDILSIIRIGISKALLVFKSPLAMILAFSAIFSSIGVALVKYFTEYNIPEIQLKDSSIVNLSGFTDLIYYVANLKQLELILNSIINIFELMVPFAILFFGSFFVGLRVYNITVAGRETLKQSVGGQ